MYKSFSKIITVVVWTGRVLLVRDRDQTFEKRSRVLPHEQCVIFEPGRDGSWPPSSGWRTKLLTFIDSSPWTPWMCLVRPDPGVFHWEIVGKVRKQSPWSAPKMEPLLSRWCSILPPSFMDQTPWGCFRVVLLNDSQKVVTCWRRIASVGLRSGDGDVLRLFTLSCSKRFSTSIQLSAYEHCT